MTSRQAKNKALRKTINSLLTGLSEEQRHQSDSLATSSNSVEQDIGKFVDNYSDSFFEGIDFSQSLFTDIDNISDNNEYCTENTFTDIDESAFEKPDGFCTSSLIDDLLLFMFMFSISKRAMHFLLLILRKHGINAPKSVYLLKKKCKVLQFDTISLSKGDFAYCGILENIKYCINSVLLHLKNLFNDLVIYINIDGVPLFKSSKLGLWPILMSIKGSIYPKPLPIAVFCGIGKPPLDTFINKLVSELSYLRETYVGINNKFIKIVQNIFIADAPARAYLQCINGHTAKVGCGYCRIQGTFITDRVCFLFDKITCRIHECYLDFKENNQQSLSFIFQFLY